MVDLNHDGKLDFPLFIAGLTSAPSYFEVLGGEGGRTFAPSQDFPTNGYTDGGWATRLVNGGPVDILVHRNLSGYSYPTLSLMINRADRLQANNSTGRPSGARRPVRQGAFSLQLRNDASGRSRCRGVEDCHPHVRRKESKAVHKVYLSNRVYYVFPLNAGRSALDFRPVGLAARGASHVRQPHSPVFKRQ
jgi:hypothetical protein